ncbi:related to AGE2-ADP-ribosylation factor and GTPase activating protein effector [Ustilago bromivora]|uniref:Related to AGE2 - ADP-ribosylation factor and GTPase activating protein effector n=1 Tax=Ustilago bromivora TaxID=307758 RepID=A0A1K0HBL7_9BASI|nr:related to AGE2-ADP-ribosylation factor and GTPase activating protein effector [Ustilago bromivora]SYW84873.1 related to AGE2 - ADP-ribosylation factor and GTPase activating protein effector [Ustilago bromivora]
MSRATQSRAQTEANAKLLRSLVKHPDNKVCADCKKNDPRWASWNIGCFLCIRCSGIHRSMGTHISKVKSIDLDIWTEEQMDSVQKWGNRRCNQYWEAHLKPGHVPADHKIESFIRSKYESRRWAMEGPPPKDPSTLDGEGSSASTAPTTTKQAAPAAAPVKKAPTAIDLLDDPSSARPPASASATKQAPTAAAPTVSAPAAKTSNGGGGGGGIFDLDWHGPSPSSTNATSPTTSTALSGAKGKNDIMSLFSSALPKPAAATNTQSGGFGDFGSFSAPISPQGNAGLTGALGGLNLNSTTTPSNVGAASAGGNPWSTTTQTTGGGGGGGGLFDTQDVWGSSSNNASSTTGGAGFGATGGSVAAKKDDAFADIWGDFK